MVLAARVLAFLEGIGPQGQCDDGRTASLRINPWQTINPVCDGLFADAKIA